MLLPGRGIPMTLVDDQARVLEEWLRLPPSRRRHATDAVAFAYRLLRDRPDMFSGGEDANQDAIVKWLLPYLATLEAG
jgi:hypothetical protein